MPEDNIAPAPEALFRANKRRKIYRKRDLRDEEDEASEQPSSTANTLDELIASASEASQARSTAVKRPAAKKQGITFSANGPRDATTDLTNIETSVVPFSSVPDEDVSAIDRFIKPTGTAVVVEDKHLTAYIDSKLARLRTGSAEGAGAGRNQAPNDLQDEAETHESQPGDDSTAHPAPDNVARNRVEPTQSRSKPARRRRPPPQKDPLASAREALVDQILHESPGEVAIYSSATSKSRPSNMHPDQIPNSAEDINSEEEDPDEAAAQAFKKQFLADLADQQNRRKKPAPPSTTTTGPKSAAEQVLSGPKLGGSRAQRQRMHRYLEETAKSGSALGAGKGGAGLGSSK